MKKSDIKRIMICFGDNDFIRVWDWIGVITLHTLNTPNICSDNLLDDTEDVENFILSLIPTGIEFIQYRTGTGRRYRDINEIELDRLVQYLKGVRFKYNFDDSDDDFDYGGSESLIIDLENNKSYIN